MLGLAALSSLMCATQCEWQVQYSVSHSDSCVLSQVYEASGLKIYCIRVSGVATDCIPVQCTKTNEGVDVMAKYVSWQHEWYHHHCMDILSEVCGPDNVPWEYKACCAK